MRLLILGGTAFLSAELARLAVADGDEVTCLARGTSGSAPDGVRWVRGDRDAGAAAYAELGGEWDAVIDVSRSAPHARGALQMLAARAGHWTYVSSISAYARHDQPGADESAELLPPYEGPGTPQTYGESKVASELAVLGAAADRCLIIRSGLLTGPGDPFGRFGYWLARFARHPSDRVLVPDVPWLRAQLISVTDMARFILQGVRSGLTGTYDVSGQAQPFADVIDLAQQVAGHRGEQVLVGHDWLIERKVDYWMGPETVPLWLPWELRGMADRPIAAARAVGLLTRPLSEVAVAELASERVRGLDRSRAAGLSPAYEAELLAAWDETQKTC